MTKSNFVPDSTPIPAIYVPDYERLKEIVEDLRKQGKKIVLTQGSWDMFHIGHALYIEKARTFGDILIVGVDSDALIKKEKGPNRPVHPEMERVPVVARLKSVNIVTLRYAEHKVGDLVRVVRPDVFVISETTTSRNPNIVNEMLEEHKGVCGDIKVLEAQAKTSASEKIRHLILEGVSQLEATILQAIAVFKKNFKP